MISVKNLVFGIAIFILTLFVGMYGISTLYGKAPQWNDYCPQDLINQTVCEQEGGAWINNTQYVQSPNGVTKPVPVSGGYCEYSYSKCQEEMDNATEKYFRKVFYVALPLGVVVIVVGAVIFGLEFVGSGLMAGGVAIIVYGVGGYWRFTDDWLKFALSLIGLSIVIWFAYYWTKRIDKKSVKEKK
jgi:hypothetical protein